MGASLGLLGRTNNLQSVGSAPSSPTLSRSPSCESGDVDSDNQFAFPSLSDTKVSIGNGRRNEDSTPRPHISTIFGSETSGSFANPNQGVVLRNKPPRETPGISSKYATLPRKSRRMSWNPLAARDLERERLEGSLLTVCTECKDMVVQVIRVSRTNKRDSPSRRSMLFSLTPDIARELQRA